MQTLPCIRPKEENTSPKELYSISSVVREESERWGLGLHWAVGPESDSESTNLPMPSGPVQAEEGGILL